MSHVRLSRRSNSMSLPATGSPSGIAKLRKSSATAPQMDQMNLDDFILPSSMASPTGLSPSPSDDLSSSGNATAPAIPIKRDHHHHHHHPTKTWLSISRMPRRRPSLPTSEGSTSSDTYDGTSARRASTRDGYWAMIRNLWVLLMRRRPGSGRPTALRRYPPCTASPYRTIRTRT